MSTPVVIVIKGDNQFENVAKQIQDQLGGIEKQTGNVGMSWSKLGGMAGSVWGGIKTAIGGVLDAVGSVAKYSGIAFTAIGASGTLALTNIVSAGATFEQKMANVASVTGAVDEEFKQMSQTALDLGSKSRAGAGAAADAMYYLGSAGYDAQQTISALDGVINLATATMSDLAFTSETVVSTITAFGLQAEDATRVSNVFAAAIAKSQLEMSNLSEAMKYVAPVAGVLGKSIEETTAALGVLSNAGFKGSMAGAALRNMFDDLLNPSKAATEALAAYGFTVDGNTKQTTDFEAVFKRLNEEGLVSKDLWKVINGTFEDHERLIKENEYDYRMLNKAYGEGGYIGLIRMGIQLTQDNAESMEVYNGAATGGQKAIAILTEAMNQSNKAMIDLNPATNSIVDILKKIENSGMTAADVMKVFGERGGPQLLALLKQGSYAVQQMQMEITNTNAATEMMNRQLDTVKGAWDLLKAALEGVWITLFQFLAPVLQSTIEHITGLVQCIREWLTTNGDVVSWGMVVVTAISAIIGPILILIGMFTGLFAVMVLFAPLALTLIGAAIAVAAAIWAIIETVRQADIDWTDAWEHVKEVVDTVWTDIRDLLYSFIEKWIPDVERASEDFGGWWAAYHEELFQTVVDKWDAIKNCIEEKLNGIMVFWNKVISPALQGEWSTAWENMGIEVDRILLWITDLLDEWWKTLIDGFYMIMPELVAVLVDVGIAVGKAFIAAIGYGMSQGWNMLPEWMKTLFRGAFPGAGSMFDFHAAFDSWMRGGGGGSQTNLPPGREFGGDHFDQKRGGAAAPRGNTYIMNFHGVTDTHEISRLVIKGIERTAQRGAF